MRSIFIRPLQSLRDSSTPASGGSEKGKRPKTDWILTLTSFAQDDEEKTLFAQDNEEKTLFAQDDEEKTLFAQDDMPPIVINYVIQL